MRRTSEIIARQVRHMTNVVDDLLDLSRVIKGLVTLAKMPLDVSLVVSNAIEQSSPLIQARRQHLSVRLAAEKTLVTGDSTRLTQVVANLVNNAARYTPEGGNIVVRPHADGRPRIQDTQPPSSRVHCDFWSWMTIWMPPPGLRITS